MPRLVKEQQTFHHHHRLPNIISNNPIIIITKIDHQDTTAVAVGITTTIIVDLIKVSTNIYVVRTDIHVFLY